MKKQLSKLGDNQLMITDNPDLVPSKHQLSRREKDLVEKMYHEALTGRPRVIRRLKSLIERYPKVIQFKNYLSVAYSRSGNMDKALEYNREILKEHPDYLFGKTNLAAQYLQENQLDKVQEILGKNLSLHELYPDRKVFHTSEFLNYYFMVGRYYLAKEKVDEAEKVLEDMRQIDKDHDTSKHLTGLLMTKRMEVSMKLMKKRAEEARPYDSKGYDTTIQITTEPTFHHPEILALYETGLNEVKVNVERFEAILQLPRKTLIEDLETILKDCIHRFEYFKDKVKQNGWDDEHMSFHFHALFLLTELHATESLPVIWEVLKQGYELLDFWFADILQDTFFEPIYKLSEQKLEVLSPILLAPGIYENSRAMASSVAANIVLHTPERRDEIVAWYREMFQHFLAHQEDNELISAGLISMMEANIMDFRGMELLPELEKLHQAKIVDEMMCGDYKEVELDLRAPAFPDGFHRYVLTNNMKERYEAYGGIEGESSEDIPIPAADLFPPEKSEREDNGLNVPDYLLETMKDLFASEDEDSDFLDYEPTFAPSKPFYRKTKKVGRNEPCPCKSGKKYKHCCGKKR